MRKAARRKQQKKDKRKVQNAVSLKVGENTFKSKLELFTYNKLIEAGIKDFKYEEMKFTILEGFEFNNDSIEAYERTIDGNKIKLYDNTTNVIRPITYLPDFTCINEETKTGWLLECKGYPNEGWPNKWKMFKAFLIKEGYNITLYKPNNQQTVLKTIELIKQRFYDKEN